MSGIPAGAGALLGKRLGKYEILALLALGGTAEIYLARTHGTSGFEKYVVVKCLHDHLADDPDFVKMFLDEARIGAMFDHSNVVQTFELGEYENRYYMVMEFLAGLSLAMIVRRATERLPGGLMPVPLVLNIAAQSCAGLHYAHERTVNGKPMNLVHRDISPQNLVISFEGVVKVVDFGIARAELRETKTKAGTIKGKFAYMSPEQCVANAVDRRTDIFALGIIVHELLTGRRLFKRNSPYETYQAVLECAVEKPSKINHQLDVALDEIVMRAVAKDKEQRYPTAEAFGDAMLGYLHHRGKGSGGGEIGRWFEQHFSQEIDEHGERMRELISGRADSPAVGWDEDEKGNATRDLTGKRSDEVGLDTADIVEVGRGSDASLDRLVGRLGTEVDEGAGDDDESQPADRTRIEMNPLEQVSQLNAQVERNSKPMPMHIGTASGASPLPAPPTGPQKPVVGQKGSGKFPDLPNMPTQIADDAKPPADLAPTAMGSPIVNAATMVAGPMSSTQYAVRASETSARAHSPTQPEHIINAPTQTAAPIINDYPVMPGGQRPFNSDLAPSAPLAGQRGQFGDAQPFSPSAAANLMSPVGDQYPQTDWERAAALPARALAPWQLAALFVGVVGGALLITLLLAKIFS